LLGVSTPRGDLGDGFPLLVQTNGVQECAPAEPRSARGRRPSLPSVLQQNNRAKNTARALRFPEIEPTRGLCTLDTQHNCSIAGLPRTRSSANFAAPAVAGAGSRTPPPRRRPVTARPVEPKLRRPTLCPLVGSGSPSRTDHYATARTSLRVRSALLLLTAACLSALLSACDYYSMSPQKIKADRRTYFACVGFVRIHKEQKSGRELYSVLFTDSRGIKRSLESVKLLEITPIASRVTTPMPSPLPDPIKDKDDDGLPFKNGWTYSWPDGTAAKLVNGRWTPTQQRNPVCVPENS